MRTSVLVTNLGVHFKQGRENSIVWVTALDRGKLVPNAQVRVADCNGDQVATAKTDAHGIATIRKPLASTRACDENSLDDSGFFVSARVDDPKTGPDMAFVRSDWNRGIESWRFNVPTDMSRDQTTRATTVFDRTLLRAETLTGFAFPSHLPSRVTIRHEGSGQTYHLPLKWAADRSADSTFPIPVAVKLGEYSVTLDDGPTNSDDDSDNNDNSGGDQNSVEHMSIKTGSFRVEKFRLPVFKGSIGLRDQKTGALLAEQIEYVSGGPAASNLPVQVSALMKDTSPSFASQFESFSFAPYKKPADDGASAPATEGDDDNSSAQEDTSTGQAHRR